MKFHEILRQRRLALGLTQEQLAHVKLPLGGLRKDQVRVIAEKHGFINARKHDLSLIHI